MFRSQSQAFHTFQRFLFANKLLNESVFAEATCAGAQLQLQILIVADPFTAPGSVCELLL